MVDNAGTDAGIEEGGNYAENCATEEDFGDYNDQPDYARVD